MLRAQDFKVVCPRNYVIATNENIIQVRVDNTSCDNVQVRTDNGKLKKIGDCTYILIPLRTGDCNIAVSKVAGGQEVHLGVRSFKSVNDKSAGNMASEKTNVTAKKKEALPSIVKPKLLFAGKTGGDIRKMIVLKQTGLSLEETPEVKSGKLKLISYEVMILENEERIFTKKMSGPDFDPEIQDAFKQLRQGYMLLFINVKCRYDDRIIGLDDLIFDLKN